MTQQHQGQARRLGAPPVARESWFDDLDDLLPEATPTPHSSRVAHVCGHIDLLARAIRRETDVAHESAERGELARVRAALANILAASEQIRAICASAESA
jgi:hypothetical protein